MRSNERDAMPERTRIDPEKRPAGPRGQPAHTRRARSAQPSSTDHATKDPPDRPVKGRKTRQVVDERPPSRSHDFFRRFAHKTSTGVGSPWAFTVACATIVVWAVTGPVFHFSDTWQLVINTGTTIVTFLMVFLIQNTQNRDALAIHLKLDELIRALKGARNQLVDIEELSDEELDKLRREFRRLGAGRLDTHPHMRDEEED
jgi:low affinity Fe/Cu permease